MDINTRGNVGTHYAVVVGNVGTVYSGQDHGEAVRTFHAYVALANAGSGRAAGESVTFMRDDEIISERPADDDIDA